MAGKPIKASKISPWGDDNPEKFKQSPPKTIGWGDQLKGLFNPDTLFHPRSSEVNPFEAYPPAPAKKKANEILLFSYEAKKAEQKITQETSAILKTLQEQVTILEKSNKGLVTELAKAKVDHIPAKTGIYYIRFLEWLLTVVKQMRMKVEEGRAWLSTFNQRKQKKMGYWKMYKKHGTTFGLSQERSLSTQTG